MILGIRAEGNVKTGLGHLVRCGAIASTAREMGYDTVFFSREASVKLVAQMGFEFVVLPDCHSVENETEVFLELAASKKAERLLIDTYEWTRQCYIKANKAFNTAVIDDYARVPYAANVLINPNLYAPELDYSNCQVNKKLLGGRYAVLRREFRNTAVKNFPVNARQVLVTMGGADVNNYTPVVLEALAGFKDITITVIIGPSFKNNDEIYTAAERCKSEALIKHAPKNIAEVMAGCDLAVSAAGTTTYELCALGVPSILISQADNQKPICEYFKRTGGLCVLGDYKDVTARMITDAVENLKDDYKARERMSNTIFGMVDLRGTENILLNWS